MFILGSLVRYQPEIILAAAGTESELGWFLGRFIRAAERFYPQLVLSWLTGAHVFFPIA
jgi:hypothetical protein